MRGRGEIVEPLGPVPALNFCLLCPSRGVSTKECYRKCDELPAEEARTENVLQLLRAGELGSAAELFGNGLYAAARELNSAVEETLSCLRAFSPLGASMTGSGSGVYAVFATPELCQWAKSRYRGRCRAYCLKAAEPNLKKIKNPFVIGEEEME